MPSLPRPQFNTMIVFNLVQNPTMIVFNLVQNPTLSQTTTLFASMLPTLLGFLQVLVSGMKSSLYELHPSISKASLAILVAYYFAYAGKFVFPGFASQFGIAMVVFGSLYVAMLLFLFISPIIIILLLCVWLLLLVIKLFERRRGQRRMVPPLLPLSYGY